MDITSELLLAAFAVFFFSFLYQLVVPAKYGYSPAENAKEIIMNKLQKLVAPDGEKLSMVNKTPEKATLDALTVGLLFCVLGTVVTFVVTRSFNVLTVLVGLVTLAAGTVVGKLNTDQLYKRWQGGLLEGVPTFIDFFPAFLEVEGIINKEALRLTLDFLPEPLYSEMWQVYFRIDTAGEVKEAFESFAKRANHPYIESICLRLSNAWEGKISPDIFDDLQDEIINIKREAAQSRTIKNKASLAMVSVIGVLAVFPVFGYPVIKIIARKFGGF